MTKHDGPVTNTWNSSERASRSKQEQAGASRSKQEQTANERASRSKQEQAAAGADSKRASKAAIARHSRLMVLFGEEDFLKKKVCF